MIKVLSPAASRMLSSSQCPVELLFRETRVGTCFSSWKGKTVWKTVAEHKVWKIGLCFCKLVQGDFCGIVSQWNGKILEKRNNWENLLIFKRGEYWLLWRSLLQIWKCAKFQPFLFQEIFCSEESPAEWWSWALHFKAALDKETPWLSNVVIKIAVFLLFCGYFENAIAFKMALHT